MTKLPTLPLVRADTTW